jgi:uncharacterized protein (TIGR03435 family)
MLHARRSTRVGLRSHHPAVTWSFRASTAAFALAVLPLTPLAARQNPPGLTVASIKPSTASRTAPHRIDVLPGGVLRASNVPVIRLIQFAYHRLPSSELRLDLIADAPTWAREDLFDVEAKADRDTTTEQMALLVRTLLEERFKMVTRTETRERDVYVLRRKRSDRFAAGLKVRDDCAAVRATGVPIQFLATPANGQRLWFGRPCASASDLIRNLEGLLATDVTDETGLTGSFDYYVSYPSDLTASPADVTQAPSDMSLVPAAVERDLGLTLSRVRRPVPILVIGSLSRPTAN